MAVPISLHGDVCTDARNTGLTHDQRAEALDSACELLAQLHQRGVLDLLRGVTGAGDDIVTRLSEAANTPEAIRAIRNLISLLRILSSVNPEILHELAQEINRAPWRKAPQYGVWTILRRLGSRDARRTIGAAAYGMQVFGRALISKYI
jgi:uncharacterized protein YjgD (DUF1641 family)